MVSNSRLPLGLWNTATFWWSFWRFVSPGLVSSQRTLVFAALSHLTTRMWFLPRSRAHTKNELRYSWRKSFNGQWNSWNTTRQVGKIFVNRLPRSELFGTQKTEVSNSAIRRTQLSFQSPFSFGFWPLRCQSEPLATNFCRRGVTVCNHSSPNRRNEMTREPC